MRVVGVYRNNWFTWTPFVSYESFNMYIDWLGFKIVIDRS